MSKQTKDPRGEETHEGAHRPEVTPKRWNRLAEGSQVAAYRRIVLARHELVTNI
jgi:hypothetical protein